MKKKRKFDYKAGRPNTMCGYFPASCGRSSTVIICPFCQAKIKAYVWSLGGSGKLCQCGAKHRLGFTYPQKNLEVDLEEASSEERLSFTILPPKRGLCEVCATQHEPETPHNKGSLYYQYKFYQENGRWPTWADAMAHCSEEIKALWTEELEKKGIKV